MLEAKFFPFQCRGASAPETRGSRLGALGTARSLADRAALGCGGVLPNVELETAEDCAAPVIKGRCRVRVVTRHEQRRGHSAFAGAEERRARGSKSRVGDCRADIGGRRPEAAARPWPAESACARDSTVAKGERLWPQSRYDREGHPSRLARVGGEEPRQIRAIPDRIRDDIWEISGLIEPVWFFRGAPANNCGAPSMEPNSQKPIAVTIPMTRKISGLGNTTVWKLIAEKKLDTVRVGKRRLVLYDSLERLLTPSR